MKVKTIKEILDIYLEKPEFKEIKEINKINKYWKNIVGELIYKNTEIIIHINKNGGLVGPPQAYRYL